MRKLKRLLLHIRYYFAHKQVIANLDVSNLGNLETEKDILNTAVNLTK